MSNLPKDNRVRVTKYLIRKAFTSLLSTKPIQNISVKELCIKADINRGTFYTHYSDIYSLLNEIEEDMMAGFKNALDSLLLNTDVKDSPVAVCTGIFNYLKENSDLCIIMLGDCGDKQFVSGLLHMGKEKCLETYPAFYQKISPEKLEYYYSFVSNGCIGLLRQWMKEGFAKTSEEIAGIASGIMQKGIGFLEE